jgi:predicted membrane channel-forming protein YqfA (hemolysin III family)
VKKITSIVTGAATLCSIPRFRTPKWRWARATLFCTIGWSGAVPMTHAAQAFGVEQADRQMGWRLMIFEGLFYITGAFIYAVSIHGEVGALEGYVLLMFCSDSFPRAISPGLVRYLGLLASDLPSLCCRWCGGAFGCAIEGI